MSVAGYVGISIFDQRKDPYSLSARRELCVTCDVRFVSKRESDIIRQLSMAKDDATNLLFGALRCNLSSSFDDPILRIVHNSILISDNEVHRRNLQRGTPLPPFMGRCPAKYFGCFCLRAIVDHQCSRSIQQQLCRYQCSIVPIFFHITQCRGNQNHHACIIFDNEGGSCCFMA